MPYHHRNNSLDHRRDFSGYGHPSVSPWAGDNGFSSRNRGGLSTSGLLPTPGGNIRSNMDQLALAGNLLGSLAAAASSNSPSNNPLANLAGTLAMAQAFQSNSFNGPRQQSIYPRNRENTRMRTRQSSPLRSFRSSYDFSRDERRPPKRHVPEEDYVRPEFEIYIGNYPVRFRLSEIRQLFEKHGVVVKAIRMKHDGDKVFAFAETNSKAEIEKAVKLMDSKEIYGRRLRVRMASDKDNTVKDGGGVERTEAPKNELTTAHVERHLVYAFIGFLDRKLESFSSSSSSSKSHEDEERTEKIFEAKKNLLFSFDIQENDESLKITRPLELIFMQNNRREIYPPKEEEKKVKRPKIEDKEETIEKHVDEVIEENEETCLLQEGNSRKIPEEEEKTTEQKEEEECKNPQDEEYQDEESVKETNISKVHKVLGGKSFGKKRGGRFRSRGRRGINKGKMT